MVDSFKLKGPDALELYRYNQSYTKEFKFKCIKAYLNGQDPYEQLAYIWINTFLPTKKMDFQV